MTVSAGKSADRCQFPDCITPVGLKSGSPWCEVHTHAWAAAAEIPLDNERIRGTIRRSPYKVPEETWVVIVEVLCAHCRVNYQRGVGTPCDSYSPTLRGGPLGTRKRKGDVEDAVSTTERLS